MACEEPLLIAKKVSPVPPPLPAPATTSYPPKGLVMNGASPRGYNNVSMATRDLWECLFDEGYRSDVSINTKNGGIIYAHAHANSLWA